MSGSLGELLRAARVRQGWDQAQFARHLGTVGQQTVSRWERGTSRPRKAMIPQIAQMLGIDAQELLDTMAGSQPTDGVGLPVRPLTAVLPLSMLADEVFERFSTDLAKQLYPYPDDVHGYGSRGHKQHGIDIEVRHPAGPPTGIQCKREKEFGPAKVRDAVRALTLEVRECVIYLSRIATPDARKEIAKHASWLLLDQADISSAVRGLADQAAAIRLVDAYFPGHREAFLGTAKPSPWESPEEFFLPLSGAPLFTHDWELVGRDRELGALAAFTDDPGQRIALVVGPGGIGKSRLIRKFSLDLSRPGPESTTVLFAAADTPVEPAQFELLPARGRLAVVIEDAHGRTDVAALVRGVLRRRPDARIVISARPYALADVQNDLRRAAVYPDDCMTVAIDELAVPDARVLAREALGDAAPPDLAEWLGANAPDCPLVIVVAAALIRRGSLDPARLPSSDRLRAEIMNAYRDAMTAGADAGDPDTRREVLNAVAALHPFRIDEDEFRSAMSALTQRPFDQVMPYLHGLEDAQVLRRRGTSLRVVPDLLGDAVLAGACVDAASGVTTGYLDRAYQAADGPALANLFVNGSRVDWQVRQGSAQQTSLVDPLWEHLRTQFEQADRDDRVALLELLRKVAAFQPGPTLDLVRWALSNPPRDSGTPSPLPAGRLAPGDQQVREALAPLLENVAYTHSHLGKAADLLWQLGETDHRETNRFPDHPIRVLLRLMEYAPTTPLRYQQDLLAAAASWLDRPDLADLPHSPFDVLDALLATEAIVQSSDGLSLTMRSYPVSPEAVRSLRDQVTSLALTELESPDLRRAVRAARTLQASLVGPVPAFGRNPGPEETTAWEPLFVDVISRISSLAARARLHPVVVIALRETLRWHYQHSATETRATAQDAWLNLPDSAEYRFALVIHDAWGTLLGQRGGSIEERDAALVAAAAEAAEAWPDADLVDRLERALDAERRGFGNDVARAGFFTWTLTQHKPSIAGEICRRVLRDHDSILRDLIPAALGRLLEADHSKGLASAQELAETGDLALVRNVVNALGWGRGRRISLIPGEDDLLRSLVRHKDPVVRQYAVAAGRTISQVYPALAAELITTVRFADSAAVADETAAAFSAAGYLQWKDLSASQAEAMIAQLAECSSIGEYWVTLLIAAICDHDPEAVLDLLIQRIETWEVAESPLDYDPLPFHWHHAPSFRTYPRYCDLLRKLLQWMAEGIDSFRRQYAGGELFALVAGNFDVETRSVLAETAESGGAMQVRAVGSILRNAPRTLLWEDSDFVGRVLRAAVRYGDDAVQQVAGGLHAAAISGIRTGTPGQPFAEDLDQRGKSAEILKSLQFGSIEQKFYQILASSAQQSIQWKTEVDDRLADRRSW